MTNMAMHEVCSVILDKLGPCFIQLRDQQEVITGLKQMAFPNCIGTINRTQVSILFPPHHTSDYIDLKGFFSVILGGVMDQGGTSLS